MIAQRFIAALLILLQCYLLSTLAPASGFIWAMSAASLIVIWISVPIPGWLYLVLGTAGVASFFSTTLLDPPEIADDWLFPGKYVYAFSQSLIFIQWIEFTRTKLSLRIHPRFSIMVLLAFLVAFCRKETSINEFQFFSVAVGMAVLFALLSQANFRSEEPTLTRYTQNSPFRTLVFILAATSIVFGTGYLANTAKSATQLLRVFAGQAASELGTNTETRVAYNPSGRLDSITKLKMTEPETVMLQSTCEVMPGYLRGRVFSKYEKNLWTKYRKKTFRKTAITQQIKRRNFSNLNIPFANKDLTFFSVSNQYRGPFRALISENTESLIGKVFFTHHEADWLCGPSSSLAVEENNVLLGGLSVKKPYQVLVSAETRQVVLTPQRKSELLQVPNRTRQLLSTLADSVSNGAGSDVETMASIEEFFVRNFTYSLESPPKQTDDFVSEFILKRHPAHCEFFATGAAMLLRLNQIPCRYVTGYLMIEESLADSNSGEMWIARNRHAHAWVEAYDRDAKTWRIVEATPGTTAPKSLRPVQSETENSNGAAGIADVEQDEEIEAWNLGRLSFYIRRFITELGNQLTSTINFLLALVLPLLVYLYYRQRLARMKRLDYSLKNEGKKLKAIDRRLKKLNLKRERSETLHQFAARLTNYQGKDEQWVHQAADHYVQYAALLYGPSWRRA